MFDDVPTVRPSLEGHAGVSLGELQPAARIVVRALRAAATPEDADDGDTDGEHGLSALITKFVAATRDAGVPPVIVVACGPHRLTAFEAHTLHALACVQAGLLGEAWQSLVQVCPSGRAGQALLRLEEAATLLTSRGDRLHRWRFEQGLAPLPGHTPRSRISSSASS